MTCAGWSLQSSTVGHWGVLSSMVSLVYLVSPGHLARVVLLLPLSAVAGPAIPPNQPSLSISEVWLLVLRSWVTFLCFF